MTIAQLSGLGYTCVVNDMLPPDDNDFEDEAPAQLSLAARILRLQHEHRNLDVRIAELYEFAYLDQLQLQRLKKKKLLIKDAIELLKDDLIPDLDA